MEHKTYELTTLNQNILVGSLLGDGSLALYGRSKNAYYREHGGFKQIPYREWKCKLLKDLNFKIRYNETYPSLVSPSNEIYTELYYKFYINSEKTVTKSNIALLNHPIGLACLYMDDGSLVIDSTKRKNNSIYIFPRISIYTLSFSKEENEILKEHINTQFKINLKLKKRKDGKNYMLEINKKADLIKFIKVVEPYVKEVSCMNYKIDIENRLKEKALSLTKEGYDNINLWTDTITDNSYSENENKLIIDLKKNNISDKDISKILNRSYWGVVDKIRRLRIENKL